MHICRIDLATLHCKTFESLLAHTKPFDNEFTSRLLGELQVEERPTRAKLRALPAHLRKLVKHVPAESSLAETARPTNHPAMFNGPEYDLACSDPVCDFGMTTDELWRFCPKCGGAIVVATTRCTSVEEWEQYLEMIPADEAAVIRAMPAYAAFIAGGSDAAVCN